MIALAHLINWYLIGFMKKTFIFQGCFGILFLYYKTGHEHKNLGLKFMNYYHFENTKQSINSNAERQ